MVTVTRDSVMLHTERGRYILLTSLFRSLHGTHLSITAEKNLEIRQLRVIRLRYRRLKSGVVVGQQSLPNRGISGEGIMQPSQLFSTWGLKGLFIHEFTRNRCQSAGKRGYVVVEQRVLGGRECSWWQSMPNPATKRMARISQRYKFPRLKGKISVNRRGLEARLKCLLFVEELCPCGCFQRWAPGSLEAGAPFAKDDLQANYRKSWLETATALGS